MHGKRVLILDLFFLISSLSIQELKLVEPKASDSYPVHNVNTALSYTAIQDAINANETLNGHIIYVDEGIYYENVVVNKSLSLGGNREKTIIEGGKNGTAVNITANNVILTRFTVRNTELTSGINLHCVNFTIVTGNIVKGNKYGIELRSSNNSVVNANQIVDNQFHGIVLGNSHNNTIVQNNFTRNNSEAINLFLSDRNYVHDNNMVDNAAAIWLDDSFFNIFSNNIIRNCTVSYSHVIAAADSVGNSFVGNDIANFNHTQKGLVLYSCDETLIIANSIENCECGLYLATSHRNRIYHNNLVDNIRQCFIFSRSLDNAWDNGFEGNYWSDYNSRYFDEYGIGSPWNPYAIDTDNIDNYPLMGKFYSIDITFLPGSTITLISNSTISDFRVKILTVIGTLEKIPTILINFTDQAGYGFSRVSIPHALMNISDTPVTIDYGFTTVLNANYTLFDNGTQRWIYFAYQQTALPSNQTDAYRIMIIAEFPSFLILPLFAIATLLAVIICRRKHHDWQTDRPIRFSDFYSL